MNVENKPKNNASFYHCFQFPTKIPFLCAYMTYTEQPNDVIPYGITEKENIIDLKRFCVCIIQMSSQHTQTGI